MMHRSALRECLAIEGGDRNGGCEEVRMSLIQDGGA